MDGDEIVNERLRLLAEYVGDLQDYRALAPSFKVYQDNKMLRGAVERTLQVAVEICPDIGRRLIALEGFRYPADNQDVFQVLREEKIVSTQLLPALLEMARFRNLIVHNYARIDNTKVYSILKRNLGDFDAFARAIVDYVQPHTKPESSERES